MTDGDRLTSTQRGKIAELHVATALMAQTGGRLSPFEPLSDDHGVDLVVLDKVTGASLPMGLCRTDTEGVPENMPGRDAPTAAVIWVSPIRRRTSIDDDGATA